VPEAVLEIAPPKLAIGHDRQSDRLLPADDLPDSVVLRGRKISVRDLAARMPLEDVAKRLRGDQAAVLVDPQIGELHDGQHPGSWRASAECPWTPCIASSV